MRLLLLFAFALCSSARLRADDVVSACVWIRAENDGSGAGFLVDAKQQWVVTCRHVVGERNRVDVYFAWKRSGSLVTEKADYLGNRDLLRERKLLVTGTVLRKSDEADLALIELDALPESVTALSLASTGVRLGDPLRVVGHRLDLETLFNTTTGPVRQTGRLANGYTWRGKTLAANADAIVGQLPIEEGDSGGPVFNAKGEVVGMASALRRQTPAAAVAISAKEIRKFIQGGTGFQPVQVPAHLLEVGAAQKASIGETLMRSTVWIRPTATDVHLAGVLIDKRFILTSHRGLGDAEQVGIAFPLFENDKWISEIGAYRDFFALHMKDAWRSGTVVARDPSRDLALIRVASIPNWMRPVKMAVQSPAVGDAIHTMSHPGGIEFAWLHAAGSIRQRGKLALAEGEKPIRVLANVLQIPSQAGSPGGPILNDKSELVGILAARESHQYTGYAAAREELDHFLDVARNDRPAKSVEALLARIAAMRDHIGELFGTVLAKGAFPESELALRFALFLDPQSFPARYGLYELYLKNNLNEDAAAELDRAIVQVRDSQPTWLLIRAEQHMVRKNWQAARGDLQRIRDVYPDDWPTLRKLIRVLLELNKDDEAASAVGDAVRSTCDGFATLAADLLEQADHMVKKFPATPSLPANWLKRAIGAAQKSATDPKRKAECEVVLKAAEGAKSDTERLAILREFLTKQTFKTGE